MLLALQKHDRAGVNLLADPRSERNDSVNVRRDAGSVVGFIFLLSSVFLLPGCNRDSISAKTRGETDRWLVTAIEPTTAVVRRVDARPAHYAWDESMAWFTVEFSRAELESDLLPSVMDAAQRLRPSVDTDTVAEVVRVYSTDPRASLKSIHELHRSANGGEVTLRTDVEVSTFALVQVLDEFFPDAMWVSVDDALVSISPTDGGRLGFTVHDLVARRYYGGIVAKSDGAPLDAKNEQEARACAAGSVKALRTAQAQYTGG